MIALIWRKLVLLARLLAAARFSVISAVAGLALLGGVVQAQNLFADLAFKSPFTQFLWWLGFLFAVFFVWAFPVHYGARRVLEAPGWLIPTQMRRTMTTAELVAQESDLRTELDGLIRWTPRVLGLLPFLAVALGLWFCDASMKQAGNLDEVKFARSQIAWLYVGDAIAAILFAAFVIWRRDLLAWAARRFEMRAAGGAARMDAGLRVFEILSLAATASFFVAAYFWPHQLGAAFDRALLIPFLLGSLVLSFSLLARLGQRFGWPVLIPIVAAAVLVTAFNKHLNDIRLLPIPNGERAATRQVDLADAVAKWRRDNGCDAMPDACPSALIIAAEGGASRAAFMAATLAGEIIDRSAIAGSLAPGKAIFALSGVSGGAYGAAAIRAALADAAEQGGAPPCRNSSNLWFGAGEKSAPDPKSSWRSCLQLLVSGDYLSSGFIGLGFRDGFAPGLRNKSLILDRAALLEQSWERHYSNMTGVQQICGAQPGKGLCRAFGYSGTSENWLPLLLLNGTSVSTGRRIIASDILSTDIPPGAKGPQTFWSQAYDVFEMMSHPCRKPDPSGTSCPGAGLFEPLDAPDLRLSTAALLSARFPIISPGGVIRNRGNGHFGDRVVDGGYFENSGLTTAVDLAEALKKLGVTPAIVWVQNDPNLDPGEKRLPPRAAATPEYGRIKETPWVEATGMLAAPLDTVLATRGSHGEEAADLASRTLARLNGETTPGFFRILMNAQAKIGPAEGGDPLYVKQCAALDGKHPAMSVVSMSWWLSAAVQAELDAQYCDSANRRTLIDLMGLVAPGQKLPKN